VEIQKAIYEFIVATVPAVILYFLGWSYLYFYLSSFGINISEFKLDLQTIFIYAYSPIQTLTTHLVARFLTHWIVYVAIVVAAVILFFAMRRYLSDAKKKKINELKSRLQTALASYVPTSPLVRALVFLFAIAFLMPLLLIPLARQAASETANNVWTHQTQQMVAIVREDDFVDDNDERYSLLTNYRQCQSRLELGLIFSDDEGYYMLCRSHDDPNTGLVFEVRREKGLMSVRYVNKGDANALP
jgi:hypothetical protein